MISLSFNKQVDVLFKKLDRWLEAAISLLPNIIMAIFVLGLFYILGKTIRDIYVRVLNRFSENKVVNKLIGTGLYILMGSVGVAAALSILKLDKAVYSLLAGAGVIGLALGFAFQEIASNFISGILIAFNKPYKVGDIVEVRNYVGEVVLINLRTTSIETYQGLEVIVPNKDMFTQVMINYSSTLKRRIDLNIGVSYNSDLNKVREIAKSALEDIPGRIQTTPIDVFFHGFGNSSIDLIVQVWVKYPGNRSYYNALNECVVRIKEKFDEHQILIPFPITTLDPSLLENKGLEVRKNIL